MKEMFIKNKIVIFRVLGAFMLVVSFAIYFWTTPKEGYTQNEIARANVARMEAKVSGARGSSTKTSESSSAKILEELKNTQAKQLQYLTIIFMIVGVGFLGYSFIKPKSKNSMPDSE